MKLDWGKKVCCPKCEAPFYSMKKTSLICPNCENKFELSELTSRKGARIARDEVIEYDEKIAISDFDRVEEEPTLELNDDNEVLSDEEAIVKEIKLTSGE